MGMQFIKDDQFYDMKGYNKIDDNAYPNLMAVLAGINVESTT